MSGAGVEHAAVSSACMSIPEHLISAQCLSELADRAFGERVQHAPNGFHHEGEEDDSRRRTTGKMSPRIRNAAPHRIREPMGPELFGGSAAPMKHLRVGEEDTRIARPLRAI